MTVKRWGDESPTFADQQADLGVGELLSSVALSGHQPQDAHEGPHVADAPGLLLQLLPLRRLVDAGEDVPLGISQRSEQGLAPGVPPNHLGREEQLFIDHPAEAQATEKIRPSSNYTVQACGSSAMIWGWLQVQQQYVPIDWEWDWLPEYTDQVIPSMDFFSLYDIFQDKMSGFIELKW